MRLPGTLSAQDRRRGVFLTFAITQETTAKTIAAQDAQFPWLRGAERRVADRAVRQLRVPRGRGVNATLLLRWLWTSRRKTQQVLRSWPLVIPALSTVGAPGLLCGIVRIEMPVPADIPSGAYVIYPRFFVATPGGGRSNSDGQVGVAIYVK